jgi:hypothetical protein
VLYTQRPLVVCRSDQVEADGMDEETSHNKCA